MIDVIRDTLGLLNLTPAHLVGALLGLLISWGSTQAFKVWCGWSGRRVAILAFVLGFCATVTVIPGVGWVQVWLAAAVGLTAPTAYKALKIVGRKREWEWIEAL